MVVCLPLGCLVRPHRVGHVRRHPRAHPALPGQTSRSQHCQHQLCLDNQVSWYFNVSIFHVLFDQMRNMYFNSSTNIVKWSTTHIKGRFRLKVILFFHESNNFDTLLHTRNELWRRSLKCDVIYEQSLFRSLGTCIMSVVTALIFRRFFRTTRQKLCFLVTIH